MATPQRRGPSQGWAAFEQQGPRAGLGGAHRRGDAGSPGADDGDGDGETFDCWCGTLRGVRSAGARGNLNVLPGWSADTGSALLASEDIIAPTWGSAALPVHRGA